MKRISVSEAKAGMTLAQPIMDQQGRVIVNSGTKLSQLYISRLEKWGVKTLSVEDDASPGAQGVQAATAAPPAAEPSVAARALPPGVYRGPDLAARIARTFSAVREDPLMAALERSVARRLTGGREG
mgnify:CR=1 FL=1